MEFVGTAPFVVVAGRPDDRANAALNAAQKQLAEKLGSKARIALARMLAVIRTRARDRARAAPRATSGDGRRDRSSARFAGPGDPRSECEGHTCSRAGPPARSRSRTGAAAPTRSSAEERPGLSITPTEGGLYCLKIW